MYVIRETIHCKPGKVRPMLEKFRGMSGLMTKMGMQPFRFLTDVSGGRFWTIVAETEVEKLDEFYAMSGKIMENDEARKIMSGYHDLVEYGSREIYRVEG